MSIDQQEQISPLSLTDATSRKCMDEMAQRLRNILAVDGLDAFLRTHALPATFFDEYQAALAVCDRYITRCLRPLHHPYRRGRGSPGYLPGRLLRLLPARARAWHHTGGNHRHLPLGA